MSIEMNKKAVSETMMVNLIYLVIVVFVAGLIAYNIYDSANNAKGYADYYSKEIVKVIDLSEEGDVISLDVQKATEIAKNNDLNSLSEIFTFYNSENLVCVKLSENKRSCYFYFKNFDIINPEVKLALGDGKNTLNFKVVKKTNG